MDWCDSVLDAEIRNWARWASGKVGGPTDKARSFECRYKSTGEEVDPKKPYDPINIFSAERMERIIRSLQSRQKIIIKHHYIFKADARHTCRRLRITRASWEMEMRSAHAKIGVAFFRDAKDN